MILKSRSNLLFISLLIMAGCCSTQLENELPEHIPKLKNLTVYPADPEPQMEIELIREQTFGSTDEVLIGKIGDIAVDDSGRVYISDVQKQIIHVFEPVGGRIAQLGREGRGPSEFSYIKRLQIRNGFLYASDANFGVRELSVFTLIPWLAVKPFYLPKTKGIINHYTRPTPRIYRIYVRNNGTYLAQFISDVAKPTKKWQNIEVRGLLYSLDSNGQIASQQLMEFKEEIRTYSRLLLPIRPFFGSALTHLSSDNTIYRAGPHYFFD